MWFKFERTGPWDIYVQTDQLVIRQNTCVGHHYYADGTMLTPLGLAAAGALKPLDGLYLSRFWPLRIDAGVQQGYDPQAIRQAVQQALLQQFPGAEWS